MRPAHGSSRLSMALLTALLVACGDDAQTHGSSGGFGGGGGTAGHSGEAGAGHSGEAGAGHSGEAGAGHSGEAGAGCEVSAETAHGEGTYYDADGSGNCSFPASPDDLLVGAMNQTDYQDAAACGACVHITGPSGEVTVRIVDRCPECAPGDIDLSPQAFAKIAALELGRVNITWKLVTCELSGNVVYHFKDGSNPWWTAVQVRNHRYPIAKFEYKTESGFKEVKRESYNYFVEPSGMGSGPLTFRITDVFGNQLTDEGIPALEDASHPGGGQFPRCAE